MTKEALSGLNEVSADAVTALQRYFHSAIDSPGIASEDKKLPDRALILLGRVNGMESTRLKAIALQFQIAKHMGLQGEPLRPLLVELNPTSFASVGPQPVEAAPLAPKPSAT